MGSLEARRDYRGRLQKCPGGWARGQHSGLWTEHRLISEFWTKNEFPVEYAGLDGVGVFAAAMREHGFTDADLDVMFKRNPARLLGLPVQ
jgi:hypothetical protein